MLINLNCYLESVDLIVLSALSFQSHLNPKDFILRFDCDRSMKDKQSLSVQLPFARFIFHSRRLKTLEYGGAWTHRYLYNSLIFDYDWLLQIEPESFCNSNFDLPKSPGIYSNILSHNDRHFLNGGAILFDASSILDIINSDLLFDSCYQSPRFSYSGNKSYFHESRIACQDSILYDTVSRLGLPLHNYQGFSCFPHFLKHLVNPCASVIHPFY